MAKDTKNSLFYMILVLTLITFISAAGLSLVNQIVQEPIRISEMKETLKAINKVLPEHDNNPFEDQITIEINGKEEIIYIGRKNGELTGIAFNVDSNTGYGGVITLMIGINAQDSTLNGMYILSHSETPGLGDRMRDKDWQDSQFKGKPISEDYKFKVTNDGGDVDVLTAATITSRAVCDAINTAYSVYSEFLISYSEDKEIEDTVEVPEIDAEIEIEEVE